jgi:3-oxoacyl-[acyl-carrier protein] reductase
MIAGASRPIGRAIAHRFGTQGVTLVLPVYDWPESIAAMEEEFSAAGYSYLTIAADLRLPEGAELLAKTISQRIGYLDYLVNNIERGGMPVVHGGYHLAHNQDQWNLEIDTTLKAKWLLFRCLFPFMAGRCGGAVQIFNEAETRLRNAGYKTAQTPFGYFLDLKIQAPGFSLARIWAEL